MTVDQYRFVLLFSSRGQRSAARARLRDWLTVELAVCRVCDRRFPGPPDDVHGVAGTQARLSAQAGAVRRSSTKATGEGASGRNDVDDVWEA